MKTTSMVLQWQKPMLIGYIKSDPDLSWRTFNISLEREDFDDPIGHLFILTSNLIMKKLPQDKELTMKFIRPLSKKKKLFMFLKDQPINYLNNTQKMIVENQKHVEPLKITCNSIQKEIYI